MLRPGTVATLLMSALFVAAIPAQAQFNTGSTLTLSISPENPKPYQTVTVTPDSTLIDLIAGTITVSVNGKVVESGTGVQSIPVTVGGPGEVTRISVTAKVGGQTYTEQVTLRPADVSLVVEPKSTVHPFYLGAALPSPNGTVRLIALADLRTTPGARINPASLIYTWRLGDQILRADSGIGRSVLTAVAPVRYRDAVVTVTVSNTDSSIVAQSSVVVSPVDPILRIYHTDALRGPDFNNALSGTYVMPSGEDAFRSVAYFFGSAPTLAWSVNGQSASANEEVTVRTTGNGAGTAALSLVAAHAATNQSVTARLPVQFGPKKSANIFGF